MNPTYVGSRCRRGCEQATVGLVISGIVLGAWLLLWYYLKVGGCPCVQSSGTVLA